MVLYLTCTTAIIQLSENVILSRGGSRTASARRGEPIASAHRGKLCRSRQL